VLQLRLELDLAGWQRVERGVLVLGRIRVEVSVIF
jgi:hypothetical protein